MDTLIRYQILQQHLTRAITVYTNDLSDSFLLDEIFITFSVKASFGWVFLLKRKP